MKFFLWVSRPSISVMIYLLTFMSLFLYGLGSVLWFHHASGEYFISWTSGYDDFVRRKIQSWSAPGMNLLIASLSLFLIYFVSPKFMKGVNFLILAGLILGLFVYLRINIGWLIDQFAPIDQRELVLGAPGRLLYWVTFLSGFLMFCVALTGRIGVFVWWGYRFFRTRFSG